MFRVELVGLNAFGLYKIAKLYLPVCAGGFITGQRALFCHRILKFETSADDMFCVTS